jgi:hypothetical protein
MSNTTDEDDDSSNEEEEVEVEQNIWQGKSSLSCIDASSNGQQWSAITGYHWPFFLILPSTMVIP